MREKREKSVLDKDPIGLKVLADVHINSKVREAFGCSSEISPSSSSREIKRKEIKKQREKKVKKRERKEGKRDKTFQRYLHHHQQFLERCLHNHQKLF